MTISALPTVPARSQAPATFIANADAFLAALPTFQEEANALAAGMGAIAAGTAFAPTYTFSTTTADSDPGAGYLRLSSATQNASTVIRADLTGADGLTWTDVLNTFDDSTSTVKGQLLLVKLGDATKWIAFNITSLDSPSGYKNINVTPVASSTTNPFSNNDTLAVKFTRNGDKGDTGAAIAPYLNIRDEKSSGTAAQTSNGSAEVNRTLNTVVVNGIAGASLASNTITLPAGTYQIRARCPAFNNANHRAYLYNSSDSTYTIIGSASYSTSSAAVTDSFISGQFTIAATKDFLIKHYTANTQVMGSPVGAAQIEVYTEVEIWKIS